MLVFRAEVHGEGGRPACIGGRRVVLNSVACIVLVQFLHVIYLFLGSSTMNALGLQVVYKTGPSCAARSI